MDKIDDNFEAEVYTIGQLFSGSDYSSDGFQFQITNGGYAWDES